jgi:hypothetical protein
MHTVGTLTFDGTSWDKRIDFRWMSAKELHWDSTQNPSDVKGVFDFREATIGSATFKEIRFQDLVNFSRTTFGRYKVKDKDGNVKFEKHPSPQVIFASNTFGG